MSQRGGGRKVSRAREGCCGEEVSSGSVVTQELLWWGSVTGELGAIKRGVSQRGDGRIVSRAREGCCGEVVSPVSCVCVKINFWSKRARGLL